MDLHIHTDKPATTRAEDCFQRYEFSKRIASIIASPKIDQSLIIGLYGKWGEGKTTVMNFIRQELPEDTVVVNFNPWMFSDEHHLLRSFFVSISKELGAKDRTIKEKIGGLLSDYGGAIGSVTQFAGFGTEGLEKLGNKLKESSIEHLKKRGDDLIILSGKNIVVFVDDIDRLDISEIQYVFKLVKLVGDFPRTAYVLSFDDEMVSAALAPKYGGDYNKAAGYNFLEKIIQMPLKIPKASKRALYKYTTVLLNRVLNNVRIELSKSEASEFTEMFNSAFLPFMENPRAAIRYANTLAFSLPLLKGEVNPVDLLAIEGIKVFYPEIYDFIRSNAYLFTQRTGSRAHDHEQQEKDLVRNKISIVTVLYETDKKNAIIDVLQRLFPQLKAVYDHTSFPDDAYTRWRKEKKICSGKYFDRYFSYTVQDGDMPDNYFNQVLTDLQSDLTIQNLVAKFNQMVEQYDTFDVIQKFGIQEEELNEKQSENLARVLAQIGHLFPIENDIHFATTYAQAARLIARLIRNIHSSNRLNFILKLLSESPSLEYALEVIHWLMDRDMSFPKTAIFPEQEMVSIHNHLVSLFKKEMTDENFFTLVSNGHLCNLLNWWSHSDSGKEELHLFWDKHLGKENKPDFALKVLKIFTPTINASSYNPQSNQVQNSSYKSGFYEANFKALNEVIDVSLLNSNLVTFYGYNPHKEGPSVISDRDPIDDNTLVSIFQWFVEHRK